MPRATPKDARPLLASMGIHSERDILARLHTEKKNFIAVALVWTRGADSPTGFSGWELVRHDRHTGDPVTDRRFGGNRFFHRAEEAEALAYVRERYGIEDKMAPVPGFQRSLFPFWVRRRVLTWIRTARKIQGDA